MNIEDIRLTEEEMVNTITPEWVERKWTLCSFEKTLANTATEKCIKVIVEFANDYFAMSGGKFARKYGREVTYDNNGFALSILQSLKKLVGEA